MLEIPGSGLCQGFPLSCRVTSSKLLILDVLQFTSVENKDNTYLKVIGGFSELKHE